MKTLFTGAIFSLIIALSACSSAGTTSEKIKNASELGQLTKLELKVSGMTCTGCEKTIEASLSELEGIASVEATFTDSTTIIQADTSKVSLAKIESTITTAGYQVIK